MTMKPRFLAWLVLAPLALAQEPTPLKLTLHDAVALALRQNPQVILANLNVAQGTEDSRVARSALLPQVGAGIGYAVNRENIEALFGSKFPGIPEHIGPFWVEQEGVHFSAPLDLTLWRRYKAAQSGIDAARAQEMTAREESVLLVVSQYLGCQRAAADVQAAHARETLAQALYDQAADLQKNGVGTGIDTLRANVELQNEKQRVIVTRTELETGLYALGRLLSVDPKRPIELADQVQFFETPEVSADRTLEHAYATRPELRQIAAQMAQAQLAQKAASESRLPTLTFSGSWAEQGLTPTTVIPSYQYQASIEVPLFTGGRIEAERAKTDITLRQLKQQEQAARDQIAQEVKTSIAQLAAARNEVTVANLGVELARQEVDQARDRFQAGVANNIEVVNAQDELARANDNQIAALYRYNQARADLAHAAGQMEALYAR